MQAQDYASVRWAVALRCADATNATIEQAIIDKTIVRTWLLRGTLHITAAADVRWLLALLGPRLINGSAGRHRQLELDDATLARSHDTLAQALHGGQLCTRADVMAALQQAGIATAGQRGYHLLHHAGMQGLICFGPSQGKQETFVLLDDWVPPGRPMAREEALAELAARYFRSHGPATLPDYLWWSGLTAVEARAGLEAVKHQFERATIGDETYWLPQHNANPQDPSPTAYLLPAFDEYFLGYQSRRAVLDSRYNSQVVSSNGIFRPMVVMDGQIVGIWKQALKKDLVRITPELFKPLTSTEWQALQLAIAQYGAFLGVTAVLAA